uniref:Uncharacterized protein n=1 Tax=Pseudomonas fluorescens (strain SBW25) TaxID=216595 RepID=A0A0G4E5E8_PSEFS|nr:hypothetical protein PQBR57_0290 [Pseudomonas fluorescens SBW25]
MMQGLLLCHRRGNENSVNCSLPIFDSKGFDSTWNSEF